MKSKFKRPSYFAVKNTSLECVLDLKNYTAMTATDLLHKLNAT